MKLKMVNDDEQVIYTEIKSYDKEESEEYKNKEMENDGMFCKEITYKMNFNSETKLQNVRNFIEKSYDVYVELLFDDVDDGRKKKFYSPDIKINNKELIIMKVYAFIY